MSIGPISGVTVAPLTHSNLTFLPPAQPFKNMLASSAVALNPASKVGTTANFGKGVQVNLRL